MSLLPVSLFDRVFKYVCELQLDGKLADLGTNKISACYEDFTTRYLRFHNDYVLAYHLYERHLSAEEGKTVEAVRTKLFKTKEDYDEWMEKRLYAGIAPYDCNCDTIRFSEFRMACESAMALKSAKPKEHKSKIGGIDQDLINALHRSF